MENCLTLIFLSSVIKLATAGNVRLVGGSNLCAGRVEVYYNGEWGTVCDDFWDLTNTAVVCRELGCGDTSNTMRAAHFGPGSGKIWMDNVVCSGSESNAQKGKWVIITVSIVKMLALSAQLSGWLEVLAALGD